MHSGSTGVLSLWNRDNVCVERTQCLCGTETVSVWNRHNVCVGHTQCLCVGHTQSRWVGGAGGVREQLQPHTGASQSPPPTHPKLLSRSCGGISLIGRHTWLPKLLEAPPGLSKSFRLIPWDQSKLNHCWYRRQIEFPTLIFRCMRNFSGAFSIGVISGIEFM